MNRMQTLWDNGIENSPWYSYAICYCELIHFIELANEILIIIKFVGYTINIQIVLKPF